MELGTATKPMWMPAGNPLRRAIPSPNTPRLSKRFLTLQQGQPAPDFTLHDPDGQPVSLSQFKGKVVLLDFWASWCGPCIADLGTLRKIKEQMASQPVVFLNVSLDENEAAWKQAIAKHQIQGVHVRSGGHSEQVAQAYNVGSLPRYYLVDPQGLIVENNRAYLTLMRLWQKSRKICEEAVLRSSVWR